MGAEAPQQHQEAEQQTEKAAQEPQPEGGNVQQQQQQQQHTEQEAAGEQPMEQQADEDAAKICDLVPAQGACESEGRELVAYTPPNQALASTYQALMAKTGLPIISSNLLKSRMHEAEEASTKAAEEVLAQEETRKEADDLLEEAHESLARAIEAHARAEDSQKCAVEGVQKARGVLEEREREKFDVQNIIDINRAEAKKLLELFP